MDEFKENGKKVMKEQGTFFELEEFIVPCKK